MKIRLQDFCSYYEKYWKSFEFKIICWFIIICIRKISWFNQHVWEKKTNKLTFYWEKYDIEINLKLDKMSNFESLYSMLQEKLQVLHEYFNE